MSIFNGLKKKSDEQLATTSQKPAEPEITVTEPKATPKVKAAKKAAVTPGIRTAHFDQRVLLSPVISEKAAHLAAIHQYAFYVSNTANKVMVKQAIKAAYKVDPVSVNIIRVEGKYVRRGKTIGKQADYKKAIITLKTGQTIQLNEGV